VHPESRMLRILVRPGVLLLRMLRRGSAIPTASFSWRIVDTSASSSVVQQGQEVVASGRLHTAALMGEFSILSNVEDAAHTQPPHFTQLPLRREQLRSLGWMMSQEHKRQDPFVTELREEAACPDAPHWRLECCLRCEYTGVKGGVLADAIGYGKTACTIGLVDCSLKHPLPLVPSAFAGFIPSRATLVLAPTNLHSQWVSEITKFTGKTFKVLSVPTCAQLKRLTVRDLVEADVVVATYRLFYSTPYLKRLQEVARTQKPDFVFPRLPCGSSAGSVGRPASGSTGRVSTTAEWARAYRTAFEVLPRWATRLQAALEKDAVTPLSKGQTKGKSSAADEVTPPKGPDHRVRCKGAVKSATPESKKASASPPDGDTEVLVVGAVESSVSKRRRLSKKQASAESPQESALIKETLSGMYVPLEVFWWRRVVCDEFHELLGRYPPAQVAVELFHADYKWGLSGTPPCQTLPQIRKAAGFLGVQLPTSSSHDDGTAEEPRKVAQEWLDAFVRRNTAELPALEEEEHIVPVHQTPQERALYLALTTQAGAPEHGKGDGESAEDTAGLDTSSLALLGARKDTSSLLKLCSHFCISGAADVVTAADECENQVALRRAKVQSVERQAKTLAERAASTAKLLQHFEPHFCRVPKREDYPFILRAPKANLVARLKFLGESSTGSKPELLDMLLGVQGGDGGAVAKATEKAKEIALSADFNPKKAGRAANLVEEEHASAWPTLQAAAAEAPGLDETAEGDGLLDAGGRNLVVGAVRQALAAGQAAPGSGLPSRGSRLRANLSMPKWPGANADEGAKADFEAANSEWLQDPNNGAKLRKVLEAWKEDVRSCSAQLLALAAVARAKLDSLHSFQNTLYASQVAEPSCEDLVSPLPQLAKYGSKIEALVKHVQKLNLQDPFCKIICFVQWEDLKIKISSALEEFGVEHVVLQGSVWKRRDVLTKFQYEEIGSPRLLLLSLEESASGTNLTAANHVILVHPMDAATKDEAVAFEMQAVGRVRRPGQQRKIFVWRFVTVGTVEQQITEEHQQELWERQKVKITLSQPALLDEGLDSDGMDDLEEQEEAPEAPDFVDLSTQRYLGASGSALMPGGTSVLDLELAAAAAEAEAAAAEAAAAAEDTLPAQLSEEAMPFFGFGAGSSSSPSKELPQFHEVPDATQSSFDGGISFSFVQDSTQRY